MKSLDLLTIVRYYVLTPIFTIEKMNQSKAKNSIQRLTTLRVECGEKDSMQLYKVIINHKVIWQVHHQLVIKMIVVLYNLTLV